MTWGAMFGGAVPRYRRNDGGGEFFRSGPSLTWARAALDECVNVFIGLLVHVRSICITFDLITFWCVFL